MPGPTLPLALPDPRGDIVYCDSTLLEAGFHASRQSPRRRVMQPLHRNNQGKVQRLVNFLQPGSYVRPHMHPAPLASETILVLRGAIAVFLFEDDGTIRDGACLRAGHPHACLADLEPGLWHTLLPLEENTAVLEIKAGPYDPANDKTFAAWAPAEDDPEAEAYCRGLLAIVGA